VRLLLVKTSLAVIGPETALEAGVSDALRAAGHEVQVVGPWDDMMGHAGAVAVHPDGLIEGATDPRADGICAAA
jgi:gamma-glutamyltranspeptidase/glutathione hydrolase